MQTAITRTSDPGRVLLVDDHPAVRRRRRDLRARERVLAMVSHELRTPITVGLGMAQTLVALPDLPLV